MVSRVLQTAEDLSSQLKEQLDFLKLSAKVYDEGFHSEAKRMATTLRVLLHDTLTSASLLGQLNLKSGKFLSTATKLPKLQNNQERLGGYSGLLGISVGDYNGYIPYLDNVPGGMVEYLNFDNYWDEIIFIDNQNNQYTRRDIVLFVADQDGGSHVDSSLSEKYAKLSRQNSLGWNIQRDTEDWMPLKGAELAAIRQITHEILKTLIQDYAPQASTTSFSGIIMGGMGIIAGYNTSKNFGKVGRNDLCPCGSGKKYKKCHGR